ncbi:MAG: GNAT family N-acetyltransferase [Acidobacteria bacterium]|nr:GNAT family N-acetyltransferase [Acidobacteriota bacterium]
MTFQYEWGDELPRLEASRLYLRSLTAGDAPAIFSIFGDPEVMRYWSSPALTDLKAAKRLIQDIQELFESRELFQWGIARQETGEVLGTCTLFKLDWAHRRGEIGFAVGRSAWGLGLGAEAVDVLLRFCFETLDLHRLEADVDPDNERSLRLLERQGFRREGYLRERWLHLGELRDTVMLGLLQREWPGLSQP